jgi:hypothetical protein
MSSTQTSPPTNPPAEGPGSGFVRGPSLALLLAVIVILDLLTFYGIWSFWPAEGANSGKVVHLFGFTRSVSLQTEFFVIVALTGALGGSIHSIRSMAWYAGNRQLRWSWAPFYILQPLVGATLATLFYLVLRAGLFSPSDKTTATSPYGFAALSALVGLFSDQAVEKLKTIAEQLFQRVPQGSDHAPPQASAAAATGEATAISTTGATLTGVARSVGVAATARFEYGLDTNYGSATADQPLPAATGETTVTATLSALQPATLYHYRFVVADLSGSTSGADRTFTTAA